MPTVITSADVRRARREWARSARAELARQIQYAETAFHARFGSLLPIKPDFSDECKAALKVIPRGTQLGAMRQLSGSGLSHVGKVWSGTRDGVQRHSIGDAIPDAEAWNEWQSLGGRMVALKRAHSQPLSELHYVHEWVDVGTLVDDPVTAVMLHGTEEQAAAAATELLAELELDELDRSARQWFGHDPIGADEYADRWGPRDSDGPTVGAETVDCRARAELDRRRARAAGADVGPAPSDRLGLLSRRELRSMTGAA